MAGMHITVGALSSKAGKTVILENAPSLLWILIFRGCKSVFAVLFMRPGGKIKVGFESVHITERLEAIADTDGKGGAAYKSSLYVGLEVHT